MSLNPLDILKNAQKIQEQMGAFQEALSTLKAAGSAGGGMVEIEMNGKMEILAVRISPDVMEDREMLQDLVMAAFNSAMEKIREETSRTMGAVAGGLGIPGFGFPGPA
jgi:DNA-binding YbaB/EbfC family protein